MDPETRLDLILRQLHEVQAQLLLQVQRCESTWGTAAILRSLRLSLRSLTSGVDPDEAPASFVLFAGRNGEAFLRRDARMALLSGSYLTDLLVRSGVALVPGQELLLEPGLALRVIEESLGCIAADSRAVEERRADAFAELSRSSGTRRTHLLLAMERLVAEETELHNRKVDLAELYDAANDGPVPRRRFIA